MPQCFSSLVRWLTLERVLFGVNVPQVGTDYEIMKRVVLACEEYGFDFVWISDHLQDFFSSAPYFECWTTLSALATLTKRIRLCTVLVNNLFRHPALVAKMGATLDVISGGRLELGIGAGWYEEECIANGIQFPRPPERIQRLEEAIQVIEKLWTENNVSFAGKYYTLKNATLNPKPMQTPHPPIWTGIMYGGRRMLKVIAKYADVWTISGLYLPQPGEYEKLRRALEANCREIGRNPDSLQAGLGVGCIIAEDEAKAREKIQKFPPSSLSVKNYTSQQKRIEGTPDQCIEQLRRYTEAGVTRFLMNFPDITTIKPVKLFAEEVIPAFRKQR